MSLHFFESEISMPAGMVKLPVRCTVVKTPKALIMISPIHFTPEQYRQIDALGEITDIVAPCLIHNRFIGQAMERFKAARIWGPMGYRQKCPHIRWDFIFGEAGTTWPHSDDLDILALDGAPDLNEHVFFHRGSGTLLVADLVFNLRNPRGWAAPLMLSLFGTYKKFACSRLFTGKIKDREAMKASLKKMMSWGFDAVVMGHGDRVTAGGHAMMIGTLKDRSLLA